VMSNLSVDLIHSEFVAFFGTVSYFTPWFMWFVPKHKKGMIIYLVTIGLT
jgi:hypothetical protein